MSYEGFITQLRKGLVDGGSKRMRRERVQRRSALGVLLVLVVAAGGFLLARPEKPQELLAGAPIGAALCETYLDSQSALDVAAFADAERLLGEMRRMASESADRDLRANAQADGPVVLPDLIRVRCAARGYEGFVPELVRVGPTVNLLARVDASWTVQELEGGELPDAVRRSLPKAARGLTRIEYAASPYGAVAAWSRMGKTGPMNCALVSTRSLLSIECGGDVSTQGIAPRTQLHRSSTGYRVDPRTALVTLDIGHETLAQSPVLNHVAFAWDESLVVPESRLAARAYDANLRLIACTGGGC